MAPRQLQLNRGDWKQVEEAVRKLATNMGDLQIVTGTIDVLKLERKEVWLGGN